MAAIGSSTTTNLANFVPYFWDAKLGQNLWANLLLYHFGVKRSVPANLGVTIRIPRPKKKFIVGTATEGTTVSPSALSNETISTTLKKFNGAYAHSDLIILSALSDVVQVSVEVLGRDIAQAMDDYIYNQLSGPVLSNSYIVGPSVNLSTNIRTTAIMGVNQVLRAVVKLEEGDNPRPPEGVYPLLMRPAQAYDLQARVSSNAWLNINVGATDRALNQVYRAALGDLYGARVYKTTRMRKLTGRGGISVGHSGYNSLLIGPESYYVTEINEAVAQVIVKPLGSGGTYDPDNSIASVAAKVFFGAVPAYWGKEKRMARLVAGGQFK